MIHDSLVFYRGDTVSIPVEILQADSAGTETAYDLTGKSCFFIAKRGEFDPDADAVIDLDWSSHDDAAAGQTTIALTATETDAIGELFFWFGVLDGTDRFTMASGKMRIKQGATV